MGQTRYIFLFLIQFFLIISINAYGQNEIDSLRNLLATSEENQRVDVLNSLAGFLLTIDPEESKSLLDESLILAQSTGYEVGIVEHLLVKATYFSKRNELSRTDSALFAGIALATDIDYQRGLVRAQLTLGVLRMRQGRYAESIEHHFEGKTAAKKLGDADLEMSHTMNIGLINQQIGKLEEAEKYLTEAMEIARENDFRFRLGQAYLNLAVLEYQKQNLGSSIEMNKKAFDLFTAEGDKVNAARALNNLGFAYNIIGDRDRALDYYDQSLVLRKEVGDQMGIAYTLLNQAKVLRNTNQNKRVLDLCQRSLEMAQGLGSKNLEMQIHSFLYQFHEERSNYREAFQSYQAYATVKDSLDLLANTAKVEELTAQYEFSRLENENRLQQQQNELQALKIAQRNQIILIISVFLVLLVLWFLWNRSALKTKLQLSQKDQLIVAREAELRIQESDNEKARLLQYADHLLLKNQALEQRRMELTQQQTENPEEKNEIDQLIDQLRHSIVGEKDWAAFRLYFDAVYPDYFQKLKDKKGVDLTLSEQRIACLLKIKLASKEIADILAISPDSVLKSKTRLRQKLQFDTVRALESFLTDL